LRGEVVVQLWSELTERLDPGSVLVSPRRTLTVEASRPFGDKDRWIVQFEGVTDRTEAESLRGVELEAEPVDMPGTLWIHELIGCNVVDPEGTELGIVAGVEANPASDLLVLEEGGLIPIRFLIEHDAPNRRILVDIPDGLLDP
jgi:16S rRNA processing protein RimM